MAREIFNRLLDDVGSRVNAGSVSVFRNAGGQWTRLHTFTPDAAIAGGGFGWRVMLVGEHLYVSQYGGVQNAPDGGLFEYDLSAPTPTILNHLVEAGFTDLLGAAFDLSGNDLLAGTPGRLQRGGIKAFERAGSAWIPHQVIEQEWSLPPTHFGAAVTTDGTHLLISEFNWPAAPQVSEPVVHAYELRERRWVRVQTLRAPEVQSAAGFGADIAMRGNLTLIARVVSNPRQVEVHAYRFVDGEWRHADSVDLEPLATTFSFVSGVRFRFVDGGVAIGLEGHSDSETGISHEVRVFALSEDGHFVGWDTLSAPSAAAWRGYGPSIAAVGDWVAVHDAYGVVSEAQIRGVTSIFRRTASGWVRHWDLPSVVAQPIGACGVGATFVAGYVAVVGNRLFVAVGGGETASGATRGASIDTYEIDASGPPQHIDSRPTGSLQVLAGAGRLALFEDGSLTFFDPSMPLSLQSPAAIVPPRTNYHPIVDFSTNHVAFGVPQIYPDGAEYMGEVHVLSLGTSGVAVPFAGRGAMLLLTVALLVVGALRLRSRHRHRHEPGPR